MMTSLVSVNEYPRKADGEGLQEQFTRRFEVQMSDGLGTKNDAVGSVGINYGDSHPENVYAKAFSGRADQRDDVCFWDVEVQYKTFGIDAATQEAWSQPNPTLRKARVSGGWESQRVPVIEETDGTLIVNSAGQVPDPRVEAEAENVAFHITAEVEQLPDWIDTYRGRFGVINDAPFRIQLQNGQYKQIKKGCARLKNVRWGELQTENDTSFFPLSFSLLIAEPPASDPEQDGWCFDMADMGKMELGPNPDPSIGIVIQLNPIQSQDGQPVTEPVLLAGNGSAVGASLGPWDSATAYKARDITSDPVKHGDVVTVGGESYYCLVGSDGSPNVNYNPPDYPDKWRKLPVRFYRNIMIRKDFSVLPACSAVT